jgi:hypothetical protein
LGTLGGHAGADASSAGTKRPPTTPLNGRGGGTVSRAVVESPRPPPQTAYERRQHIIRQLSVGKTDLFVPGPPRSNRKSAKSGASSAALSAPAGTRPLTPGPRRDAARAGRLPAGDGPGRKDRPQAVDASESLAKGTETELVRGAARSVLMRVPFRLGAAALAPCRRRRTFSGTRDGRDWTAVDSDPGHGPPSGPSQSPGQDSGGTPRMGVLRYYGTPQPYRGGPAGPRPGGRALSRGGGRRARDGGNPPAPPCCRALRDAALPRCLWEVDSSFSSLSPLASGARAPRRRYATAVATARRQRPSPWHHPPHCTDSDSVRPQ